jgi:hypothetical protein
LDTQIYMKAPTELIKSVAFHIQGEKAHNLDPDLLSDVRKITQNGPLVHAAPIKHGQMIKEGPLVHAAPIEHGKKI